ncbi:hypothetical protein O6H91_02G120400 [Diphasiastrum complanatum]|uniref:Uncharacterized protein n=3 Tax=Diphasiastrum complanatum TaxID=34168 RepID=A0ACC2EJV9_DIPCM|nr:hypothetical protein O6H91_02G120400 [Diphasiastrum complanatum]
MGYHSFFRFVKGFSTSLSTNTHADNALSLFRSHFSCQPRSLHTSKEASNRGLLSDRRHRGPTTGFIYLHLSSFEGNNTYGKNRQLFNISELSSNARMMSGLGTGQDADISYKGANLETKVRKYSGQKSQATFLYLVAMVVGMVGITYAAVPLYRKFCQATGYGGTVQRRETVEEKIARHSLEDPLLARELVVQFNADVADGMPWRFTPSQREVRVKPGQSTLAFYTAENRSSEPITGVSTYNVTPMKAGVYFNKIQCFCFEEQRLLPGEKIDMPVFFYIDREFATDPKMSGINNLILSYTFFKVEDGKE